MCFVFCMLRRTFGVYGEMSVIVYYQYEISIIHLKWKPSRWFHQCNWKFILKKYKRNIRSYGIIVLELNSVQMYDKNKIEQRDRERDRGIQSKFSNRLNIFYNHFKRVPKFGCLHQITAGPPTEWVRERVQRYLTCADSVQQVKLRIPICTHTKFRRGKIDWFLFLLQFGRSHFLRIRWIKTKTRNSDCRSTASRLITQFVAFGLVCLQSKMLTRCLISEHETFSSTGDLLTKNSSR